MIELKHIKKEFPGKKETIVGVDDVSLTIEKGEIFGIVGYSGAGKSTLLRCMNILERPTSGSVKVGWSRVVTINEQRASKSQAIDRNDFSRLSFSCLQNGI